MSDEQKIIEEQARILLTHLDQVLGPNVSLKIASLSTAFLSGLVMVYQGTGDAGLLTLRETLDKFKSRVLDVFLEKETAAQTITMRDKDETIH